MRAGSIVRGVLSTGALLLPSLRAQTHKVAPPAAVTRAVAVYEWTGAFAHPASARLIPVSLFLANPMANPMANPIGGQIGGHFEDAGVYLAQPVPFALRAGDVYSIERSGQSLGLLELTSAKDVHTRADAAEDNPLGAWFGYGRLLTAAEEAEANTPRAAPPDARAVDASRGADAPPVLRHRSPSGEAKMLTQHAAEGYVTPPSTPLNDDPDRPILHRGIPAKAASPPPLTTLPPNLHRAVAISDPVHRSTETFAYMWPNATARTRTLSALEALSGPIVDHYIAFNKLTPVNLTRPSPGPSFANTPREAPPAPRAVAAYALSAGDLPTFVYTAEVPVTSGGPIYLTLIAQRVASGGLHLALRSITDAAHLDRTPRLLLIDAVDPDASHRASLLFELRAQSSRQFALYNLNAGDAEQTFITAPIE